MMRPFERRGRDSVRKVPRPDEVDQLPDDELAVWLEAHTDWGVDFDPEAQAPEMRRM